MKKAFHQCYPDAIDYVKQFSANGGSAKVRSFWDLATKAIIRLLRFTPQNLHESEALDVCEKMINSKLYQHGKLLFCNNCCDFQACKANAQMYEVLKDG